MCEESGKALLIAGSGGSGLRAFVDSNFNDGTMSQPGGRPSTSRTNVENQPGFDAVEGQGRDADNHNCGVGRYTGSTK